jgi:hypothetical protein
MRTHEQHIRTQVDAFAASYTHETRARDVLHGVTSIFHLTLLRDSTPRTKLNN